MNWTVDPPSEELEVLLEAAILYRDAGCLDHARDIFQGVRSLSPSSEIPEVGLGTVAFQRGRFEEAKKHYLRALQRNPDSAWAHAHLGEAELFLMNREEARLHLVTAQRLDPGGPFSHMAQDLGVLVDSVQFGS